jgi:signal transduction histidine kinase
VTRRFHHDQLFAGLRAPLRRVLRRLQPRLPAIDAAWRRGLTPFVRRRAECRAVAALSLRRHHALLAAGELESFTAALEESGRDLARRGVAEEHAFLALALYVEQALAVLSGLPAAPGEAVALIRLFSVAQLYLRMGYAGAQAVDRHALEEQDRLRLGRDLHDEIGHALIVLKLNLEQVAASLRQGGGEQAGDRLQEALSLAADALASVRRVILDLGPAVLDEQGLEQAVRLYASQFAARTGIEVKVRGGLPAGLPPSHQRALYRVLQGALSNVLAHARARAVVVTLAARPPGHVSLAVRDDGAGFDARRRSGAQSFGLRTMRERMAALGGRFRVESRAGGGTRVEVRLPLPHGGRHAEGPAPRVRRPRPVPRGHPGRPARAAGAGRGGRGRQRPRRRG